MLIITELKQGALPHTASFVPWDFSWTHAGYWAPLITCSNLPYCTLTESDHTYGVTVEAAELTVWLPQTYHAYSNW